MTEPANFVRYSDGIETVGADEGEVIDGIIASMTHESQIVANRDGHTVRASHAKSTGLATGSFSVLPDLPEPLRQGLFAEARSYPVLVRFAQGPGEKLSDSVSTHRGVSLKILGVPGPKLPGHGADTQDFVLATGTAFAQADAATFLGAIRNIEKNTGRPELLKRAVSTAARVANAAYNALGSDSPTFGFFGHTKRNPLADAYFSQAAMRFGDYVAKLGLFPVSPKLIALADETLDTGSDPDAFQHAVAAFLRSGDAEFELRAQLCTDLQAMPVEDASVPWPEDQSPYRPVARLHIPAQDSYSPQRQAYFDEVLSFQPAHSLAAHRPLGSLMRARLRTYQALSSYRHGENHQRQAEPASLDEVPH